MLVGAVLAWRAGLLAGDLGGPVGRWLKEPAGWHWLWLLVLPLLAVALVGACVPPGLLWRPDEPHGYDVVEYHFQVPREWYEAGASSRSRTTPSRTSRSASRCTTCSRCTCAAGPGRGCTSAQLMHVVHVVLSVVAVYGVASSLSQRRSAAVAAALLAAGVPWLTLLRRSASTRGGCCSMGRWPWAGPCAMDAPPRGGAVRFAVAGAMAGFACGVKLTAVPMLLVAVPVAVVVAWPRGVRYAWVMAVVGRRCCCAVGDSERRVGGQPRLPGGRERAGEGALFGRAGGAVAAGAFAAAGPAVGGGRLGRGGREIVADWRFGYVPLAVGVVGAVLAFRDPRGRALAVLLLLLLGFWLGFTHFQGRFFVLAVPVLALGVALADWRRWGAAVVVVLALSGVLSVGAGPPAVSRQAVWRVRLGGRARGDGPEPGGGPARAGGRDADARRGPQAFYYQRPMATLRYRTVFDVDVREGQSAIDAWKGAEPGAGYLLVDPEELRRFHRTYWGIPELPAEWETRTVRCWWGRGANRPFRRRCRVKSIELSKYCRRCNVPLAH